MAKHRQYGVLPKPVADRIHASVMIDPETGCWEWQKFRNLYGYGAMSVGSRKDGTYRTRPAHRVSYETFVGPIPEGLQVDHLCFNPGCVNPEHLQPVSVGTNARRRVAREAGQTWCRARAHIETKATTYFWRGETRCRVCDGLGLGPT